MVMSISPETERLLNEVVASGHFESQEEALAHALRLLRDSSPDANGHLALDRWREKFQEHLAATPNTTATVLDDSRESIYEGRGE